MAEIFLLFPSLHRFLVHQYLPILGVQFALIRTNTQQNCGLTCVLYVLYTHTRIHLRGALCLAGSLKCWRLALEMILHVKSLPKPKRLST